MKALTISLLALVTFSSCGKNLKYFTEDLYDEYRWSEQELKSIQFYVSEDIVLYRGDNDDDSRIKDGKILVENDRKVEEVIIKKGTPGVFVMSPKENRFAISFASDNDEFLMFGPNSKANGKFVLLAKEWERRSGEISYGGKTWRTSSDSAYAGLMVDIKKAGKTKYQTEKADGRRVRSRG